MLCLHCFGYVLMGSELPVSAHALVSGPRTARTLKAAYHESQTTVSAALHVQHNTGIVLFPAGNCLQRLDLSDNPMTGDVAESLAEMLKGQPHLRALNLNDTSLEDAGVSTIAQALAQ